MGAACCDVAAAATIALGAPSPADETGQAFLAGKTVCALMGNGMTQENCPQAPGRHGYPQAPGTYGHPIPHGYTGKP